MLSLTALVLVGGAAGDQFGRRRVFSSAPRCSPPRRCGAASPATSRN
jgi:hypothetical protein